MDENTQNLLVHIPMWAVLQVQFWSSIHQMIMHHEIQIEIVSYMSVAGWSRKLARPVVTPHLSINVLQWMMPQAMIRKGDGPAQHTLPKIVMINHSKNINKKHED